MKKKSVVYLIIALLVLVGVAFWSARKCYTDKRNDSVSIGAVLPLTGDAASYGTSLKKGLDLALDGSNVKIVYEDSKGEPKTAVSIVNKLISVDKVGILIGDMFTNTTMAIMPIASKNGILLLTPTASSSELSEKGETTFRLYPSEKEEGKVLLSFYQKEFHDRKGAIIVVNEDAMMKVASIINQDDSKQVIVYTAGLTDFTPIIQKIESNTEVVFLIGYFEECRQLIKQSIEMSRNFSFIGLSTLFTPLLKTTLGSVESPVFMSAPKASLDTTNVFTADFIKKYLSKYGEEPDIWAGYGYDSGCIVLNVIQSSRENGTSYVKEMYNVRGFDGITGMTTINEDRSINKSMDIVKYANGDFSAVSD